MVLETPKPADIARMNKMVDRERMEEILKSVEEQKKNGVKQSTYSIEHPFSGKLCREAISKEK